MGIVEELGSMNCEDAAKSIGVELRGDDGQPYCCGGRMNVKGGIVGVDYASCLICGNLLYRVDSPHTNGGNILSNDAIRELGNRVWIAEKIARDQSAAQENGETGNG